MRRAVGNVVLALCGLVLAIGSGEGLVRVAGLGRSFLTRGGLHEFDARAGWRCRSNLDAHYVQPRSFDVRIRCNAAGLRGGEVPRAKPAGRTRVAVLGDSFMWGYGVEDDQVFARVLGRHLAGSDSVNLAANGYSTVQELIRFEDAGLAYDPDVVVVGFYWNDLEDNFDDKRGGRPVARLAEPGALHIDNLPVRRRWKSGAKQWLRHHSRLFGFLEYGLELGKLTWKSWLRSGPRARAGSLPPPASSGPGTMEFTERELYAPPRPELDRAWEAVRLLLARIDARQRERGGRTLVMYVPGRGAVTPAELRRRFGDDRELDWSRPADRLGDIARSLGVACLDLTPVFAAAPDPASLFLPHNGHWNAAGHALAARAAAARIRELSGGAGTGAGR